MRDVYERWLVQSIGGYFSPNFMQLAQEVLGFAKEGVLAPVTQLLRPSPAGRVGPGGVGGVREPCNIDSCDVTSLSFITLRCN